MINNHIKDRKHFRHNSMSIIDILQSLILDKPLKIDSITGVATLPYAVEVGNKMLRYGRVTAVVIGIDDFKKLNDSYGHLTANNLLIEFGQTLQQKTKNLDCIVGRLGGDVFLILIMGNKYISGISVTEYIKSLIGDENYKIDPKIDPIKVDFSIGQATTNKKDEFSIRELLQEAETNMNYNKYMDRSIFKDEIQNKNIFHNQANYLLKVLAEKDMYTYVHSQYTAKYAVSIAEALNLTSDMIEMIYFAGWLHDIGKVVITSEILRKPSRLDNYEYDIIKFHVVNGLNIITAYDFNDTVRNAISFHHERWDGKGYPNGILGKDTPIEGRIMQVADAFSAMTVKRIYKEQMSMEGAMEEIIKNSGTQFDPDIANVFIELLKKEE